MFDFAQMELIFLGLSYVLDNHMSHKTLAAVLPTLSNLIHDVNSNVKIAFVDLLLKVKTIKGIHFYEVTYIIMVSFAVLKIDI